MKISILCVLAIALLATSTAQSVDDQQSALIEAIKNGNVDRVSQLLSGGTDPNTIDETDASQASALIWACYDGQEQMASALLEHGADVNKADSGGGTPLINAAAQGHDSIVAILLRAGADINHRNQYGMTALMFAINQAQLPVTRSLLAAKADPSIAETNPGETSLRGMDKLLYHGDQPIHRAVARGDTAIVSLLLQYGASLECNNADGETPLMVAANEDNSSLVRFLVARGANINHQDSNGNSSMWNACTEKRWNMATALADAGADVNLPDKNGASPLAQVMWDASQNGAGIILDHGGNLLAEDSHHVTPLEIAYTVGDADLLSFLGTYIRLRKIPAAAIANAKSRACQRIADKALTIGELEQLQNATVMVEKLCGPASSKELRDAVAALARQKADPSLADIEAEERSIARDISISGAGSRLVIPGITTQSAQPSALTISETSGLWSTQLELPSDRLAITNSQPAIFGSGSIHRFRGEVRFDGPTLPVFIGTGDETQRLAFVLLSGIGYVYLRGEGRIVYQDGRSVQLGQQNDFQSTKSSTPAHSHAGAESWVPEAPLEPPSQVPVATAARDSSEGPLAHPQPSSTRPEIRFELKAPCAVHVVILNVSGKLIRTIDFAGLPAGKHDVVWDGRDDAGHKADPGLYIVRIEMGGRVETARMVVRPQRHSRARFGDSPRASRFGAGGACGAFANATARFPHPTGLGRRPRRRNPVGLESAGGFGAASRTGRGRSGGARGRCRGRRDR